MPVTITEDSLRNLDKNTVFYGSEWALLLSNIDLERLGFTTRWTPAANFASLLISPLLKPFDRAECRQIFAESFRRNFAREIGNGIKGSPGLFPQLVSGYLPPEDFAISTKDRSECLLYMRKNPIQRARLAEDRRYILDRLIELTAKDLDLDFKDPIIVENSSDMIAPFLNGRSSFYANVTGFWALDPVGDIRMLFTPNLHPMLQFVWSDATLQEKLKELGDIAEGSGIKSKMEEINRYVFEQALINPAIQFRKVYAARDPKALRNLPLAVQEPYPWQILSAE